MTFFQGQPQKLFHRQTIEEPTEVPHLKDYFEAARQGYSSLASYNNKEHTMRHVIVTKDFSTSSFLKFSKHERLLKYTCT